MSDQELNSPDHRFFSPPEFDGQCDPSHADSLWHRVPEPDDIQRYAISPFLPHLSKRMQRVLAELRLETIGDLTHTKESELYAHGAGLAGIVEIKIGVLDPKGLTLDSNP